LKAAYKYISSVGLPVIGALFFYLLDPYNFGYVFGYMLIILALLKKQFLLSYLDRDFFFLFLFSILYTLFYLFNLTNGVQYIFIYAFFPGIFYLMGKYLNSKAKSPYYLFYIFFFVGFVFSISAIISIILNLNQGGFAQLDRTIPLFWNNKPIKATLMAGYLVFNVGIPALILINRRKIPFVFSVFALAVFTASLFSIFRLGSRTLLLIIALDLIIAFIFVIPRQRFKDNFRLIVFTALLVILGYNFIPFDLNADYLSVLGSRLQQSSNAASAGGRSELWSSSLANIFRYPFGWSDRNFRFAHNMWLDTARVGGIIPFTLLIIFTIRSLRKIFKIVFHASKNILLNTIIAIYTLSSFLVFFVEPVMEGLFHLFVVFCLFQGIINGHLQKLSVSKKV